jgi:hypothetical protein
MESSKAMVGSRLPTNSLAEDPRVCSEAEPAAVPPTGRGAGRVCEGRELGLPTRVKERSQLLARPLL